MGKNHRYKKAGKATHRKDEVDHQCQCKLGCHEIYWNLQAAEGAELEALNAEADMPIEQLLELYKGMREDDAEDKLSDSESNRSEPMEVQGDSLPDLELVTSITLVKSTSSAPP